MSEKLCLLGCHNFHREIAAAIAAEGWDDVIAVDFPSRCGHPPISWEELQPLLPEDCGQLVVMGRACLSALGEPPPYFPPTRIMQVEQCFHLVAGQQLVNEAIGGGGYLITPAWLADWRGQLQKLGFAPDQGGDFFQDFAKELVLLDTGIDAEAKARLAELSDAMKLPARRIAVGLDITRLLLAKLVLEWRREQDQRHAREQVQRHAGELADPIAVMDMLTRLARIQDESEAIAAIEELFQMLFAPEALYYLRMENNIPIPGRTIPAEILATLRALHDDYALTADGRGFLLRIGHGDEVLGLIAIDGLVFPKYRDRYLNLALAVTGVCGLAIENARNRRRLLMEREQQYNTLADSGQALVWTSGTDKQCNYFNKVWLEFTGRSIEQELGNGWTEGVHPDDFQRCLDVYVQAFDRREKFSMDYRLHHGDGEYHWIQDDGSPRYDSKGEFAGYIGHCLDITERKRVEAALRLSEQRFHDVSDAAGEYLWEVDLNLVYTYVSNRSAEVKGYSPEELLGHTPMEFMPEEDLAPVGVIVNRAIANKAPFNLQHRDITKSGAVRWEEVNGVPFYDENGTMIGLRGAGLNITERKQAEAEIQNLAFYDPLTKLPNRRLLVDRLNQALASSERNNRQGALLFLDLDNFKALNDTLGHDIGDQLLQQVAQRLETSVRQGDTVARLGGDEFVVMLEDLSEQALDSAAQAEAVGEKILAALSLPYLIAKQNHHSTTSIGVTLFSDQERNQDELLKQADIAMYHAKGAGRNTLRFFDPQMQNIITARVDLESDLRRSVAEQEQFQLYYQVQVDSSGRPVGAEALLRWKHPVRGMVSPAEFIPLAEETRLILPLGHWVITTACQQLAVWATQPEASHLTLAVNVSAKQFQVPTFVEEVLTLIDYFKIDPTKLKLEITETMLLDNLNDIIIKMAALKSRGVNFSMDDFGTGYSSLQYLKQLSLDQLKIDQSFVRDIVADSSDRAIVRTIISMAHSLNLNVIAEGVEAEAQLSLLEQLGCMAYQGYFFSKPVPIEQFEEVLKECTKSKKPIKQEPMRAAAEAQLAREYAPTLEPPSAEKLLHELQVHQVELEMQNEQLRQSQIELEKSRDRYVDFYDFAPVGYLTLSHEGMIDEINLTGAALLKVERNKLPYHRFASYVATEDRNRWDCHFMSVLKDDKSLACELALQHGSKPLFYAHLDCLQLKKEGKEPVVRIVLTDITERKQV